LDTQSSVRPALLTLRQAADYLAVSYWTVRSWADAGRLRVVRLPGDGRLIRVERVELERLIAASR
jgi:excisionase family DNA binding protein